MNDTAFILFRPPRQTRRVDGRFEYRVWPRPSHPAVSMLQGLFPLTNAERRVDIYLMGEASDAVLVKLRDGSRLEIKRRGKDVGSVQFWEMPVSTRFPLTVAERVQLAAALGLQERLSAEAGLSPAHLLTALAALRRRVDPRMVRKSRLVFDVGGCRAEICRVATGDRAGLSVALEATDIPSIASAMDTLRIGGLPNRSFGEALCRLFAAHPDVRGLPAAVPHNRWRST